MKKYRVIQYTRNGVTFSKPEVVRENVSLDDNHTEDYNAQFRNTGLMYIGQDDEVPAEISFENKPGMHLDEITEQNVNVEKTAAAKIQPLPVAKPAAKAKVAKPKAAKPTNP